jgi:hypothetical protein
MDCSELGSDDESMASRKIKVPMADGTMSEGTEVPVAKSSEPWTELELEDGAILRLKNVVASVIRLDGKFDQEKHCMDTAVAAIAKRYRCIVATGNVDDYKGRGVPLIDPFKEPPETHQVA